VHTLHTGCTLSQLHSRHRQTVVGLLYQNKYENVSHLDNTTLIYQRFTMPHHKFHCTPHRGTVKQFGGPLIFVFFLLLNNNFYNGNLVLIMYLNNDYKQQKQPSSRQFTKFKKILCRMKNVPLCPGLPYLILANVSQKLRNRSPPNLVTKLVAYASTSSESDMDVENRCCPDAALGDTPGRLFSSSEDDSITVPLVPDSCNSDYSEEMPVITSFQSRPKIKRHITGKQRISSKGKESHTVMEMRKVKILKELLFAAVKDTGDWIHSCIKQTKKGYRPKKRTSQLSQIMQMRTPNQILEKKITQ